MNPVRTIAQAQAMKSSLGDEHDGVEVKVIDGASATDVSTGGGTWHNTLTWDKDAGASGDWKVQSAVQGA